VSATLSRSYHAEAENDTPAPLYEREDPPMDVYVVEDEPVTRATLIEALSRRGHTVAAYADGEEAWLACQRQLPSLVLVDWLLPGIDGLELSRRIRSLPTGRSTVILIVTARDRPGDLETALGAGVDDYLAKPLRLETLAVRLAVEEKRVAVVQARDRAEAALQEHTRLQGALLAAGTVQHYLGNQLSITMGYAELLASDARMHPDLRPLALEAVDGVVAARETLARLLVITRIETLDGLGGPPVLDLERSAPLDPALNGGVVDR
jgi:DNA-binding response OmpR family regulator